MPFTARITTNIQCSGQNCSAVTGQNVAGLFQISADVDHINVAFDPTILAKVASLGNQAWTGQVTVSAANYTDLTVPMTLNIGAAPPVGVTPSSLPLYAAVGAATSATVTLSSAVATNYQTSVIMTDRPDAAWLSVYPAAGTISLNPTLTVYATAVSLPQGSYRGTVKILVNSLDAASVSVIFNVGATGTLTLSSSSLGFSYLVGSSLPATQYVTAYGTAGTTYSASATTTNGVNWLLVNSSTSTSGIAINSSVAVSVNVAALPQSAGTYTGYLSFLTTDNKTAQITVTLQITTSSAGPVSPGQLSFSYPVIGGATPGPQYLTLTGNGTFTAVPTTYSGGSAWLAVSPSGAITVSGSTQLSVTVYPQGLPTGNYSGAISVYSGGQLVGTVSITLAVGSGTISTGVLVSPSSVSFTVASGMASTFPQQLAVAGQSPFTVQPSSSGNWLSVSPTSGTAPATLTASVNVGSLTAGSYSGSLFVTSGTQTQTVPVSLSIVVGAVVTTNPGSLVMNYQAGQSTPGPQNIYLDVVNNTTGSPLSFTASSSVNWLTLGTTAGTVPGAIAVALVPANLTGGVNTGVISISVPGAANTPINYPVTVVASGIGGITLSPSTLSFAAAAYGAAPASQNVSVNVGTGNVFTASASSSGNWLSVSPTSGTSPGTLTVSVNPANLAANTYTGTITVTGNGVTAQVTVTFVVGGGAAPTLSASPASLTFNAQQGAAAPAAQTVQLSTGGVGANFTVASSQSWLTATPISGSTPASLSVSVNPANLSVGASTGTLTITSAGATNSPLTVNVTVNVTAPPQVQTSTNALSFSYRTGGAAPDPQTVQVNSTGSSLSVSVSASSAGWLSATPTSGTTPLSLSISVNPGSLSPGSYTGTVSVSATGSSQSVTVTLTVMGPLPTVTSVVNAASFLQGAISPGEIITLAGQAIGPPDLATLTVSDGVVATSLGSVRVLIGGILAPLIYVSATQSAAVVPYGIAGRTSTTLQVEYQGQRSNSVTMRVGTSAPGIFTANSSGTGPGAILNADGSLNAPGNGAARDSVVVLYVTGEGQTIPGGADGRITTAEDPGALAKPVLRVSVLIDGQPAEVLYAGAAPGLVAGVMQVNARIPAGARSGDVPLVVTVGNANSQEEVTVSVR